MILALYYHNQNYWSYMPQQESYYQQYNRYWDQGYKLYHLILI